MHTTDNILDHIASMNPDDLDRLQRAIDQRRRQLATQQPTSLVVEYRPHADGMLQLEKRLYVKKDGQVSERGPYWYFRYHQQGRQRTLYLGKTDDPEGKLEERRRMV